MTGTVIRYLVDNPRGDETTQEWLNRRGSQGWELVQILFINTVTGFFKQEVEVVEVEGT